MSLAEDEVPFAFEMRSPATLTSTEFEDEVARLIGEMLANVEPEIAVRERVHGSDGDYEIDVTARYRVGPFDHLLLVEAKLWTRPVDRSVVQVLLSKLQSVGAQKGAVFSTAPFQRGAIGFAAAHGIGLVQLVDDEMIIEHRDQGATTSRTLSDGLSLGLGVRGLGTSTQFTLLDGAEQAQKYFAEIGQTGQVFDTR